MCSLRSYGFTLASLQQQYSAVFPSSSGVGCRPQFSQGISEPPSHPAKSAKAAAEKFRKCKAGFFEALRMTAELRTVIQALGYSVIVH
jgi:hypothetical protein